MPQWWHLMVLQYVAASFHLPSVSTPNFNTVQNPKPHKHYETITIPNLVISKVLLPQSNFKAAFVHRHSSLLSDIPPCLPKYSSNITQYAVLFPMFICCRPPHTLAQNVQLPTQSSTFNLSMPHRTVVITLCNWATNYEYWTVAEQNASCGFCHDSYFEMIYWAQ